MLGLDLAYIRAASAVEAVVAQGDKAAAHTAMQALWDEVVPPLAAAHAKAADLHLALFNPFDPATAEQVEAELAPVQAELKRLSKNNSLLRQSRPDQLERLGETADDNATLAGKLYTVALQQQTLLSMHGLVNLAGTAAKESAAPSPGALYQRLEAAAASQDEVPSVAVQIAVEEIGSGLRPDAEMIERADDFADTLGYIRSMLLDHVTALEALDYALTVCPGSAPLWAQRAQVRVTAGDAAGAYRDILIASAIDEEAEPVQAAKKAFMDVPSRVDQVYLEPVNEAQLAGVALSLAFGGTASGENDLIAAAARRNFGRRIYAASLLKQRDERQAALAWVVSHGRENGTLPCQALKDALAGWEEENAAAGNSVPAILAVHNRHIGVLAGIAPFWKIRFNLFLEIGRKDDAQAALDVAEALQPDADWLPDAKARLDAS